MPPGGSSAAADGGAATVPPRRRRLAALLRPRPASGEAPATTRLRPRPRPSAGEADGRPVLELGAGPAGWPSRSPSRPRGDGRRPRSGHACAREGGVGTIARPAPARRQPARRAGGPPGLDLGARFALVIIALNSLVLLGTASDRRGLRAAARHLRPGGLPSSTSGCPTRPSSSSTTAGSISTGSEPTRRPACWWPRWTPRGTTRRPATSRCSPGSTRGRPTAAPSAGLARPTSPIW